MSEEGSSTFVNVVKDVAEAAEEFVDKVTGVEAVDAEEEESGQPEGKLSMDDRKAKLDQLRKKMVRYAISSSGLS